MDKSFNEQELSDIMKEIEALEEEFNAEPAAVVKPVMQMVQPEPEPEPEAEIMPEASMKSEVNEAAEVMQELAKMEEEMAMPKMNKSHADVISFDKPATHKSTAQTSMSFKVQGDLNLDLQFEIGGKMVFLGVSQTGLTIQMEGGVTFTVPVGDSFKKVV